MFVTGGVMQAAESHGADAASTHPTSPVRAAFNPADFVGAETCETCHADEAKGLGRNPHSKLALEHNGKGVTCEGCHGPGHCRQD